MLVSAYPQMPKWIRQNFVDHSLDLGQLNSKFHFKHITVRVWGLGCFFNEAGHLSCFDFSVCELRRRFKVFEDYSERSIQSFQHVQVLWKVK